MPVPRELLEQARALARRETEQRRARQEDDTDEIAPVPTDRVRSIARAHAARSTLLRSDMGSPPSPDRPTLLRSDHPALRGSAMRARMQLEQERVNVHASASTSEGLETDADGRAHLESIAARWRWRRDAGRALSSLRSARVVALEAEAAQLRAAAEAHRELAETAAQQRGSLAAQFLQLESESNKAKQAAEEASGRSSAEIARLRTALEAAEAQCDGLSLAREAANEAVEALEAEQAALLESRRALQERSRAADMLQARVAELEEESERELAQREQARQLHMAQQEAALRQALDEAHRGEITARLGEQRDSLLREREGAPTPLAHRSTGLRPMRPITPLPLPVPQEDVTRARLARKAAPACGARACTLA